MTLSNTDDSLRWDHGLGISGNTYRNRVSALGCKESKEVCIVHPGYDQYAANKTYRKTDDID